METCAEASLSGGRSQVHSLELQAGPHHSLLDDLWRRAMKAGKDESCDVKGKILWFEKKSCRTGLFVAYCSNLQNKNMYCFAVAYMLFLEFSTDLVGQQPDGRDGSKSLQPRGPTKVRPLISAARGQDELEVSGLSELQLPSGNQTWILKITIFNRKIRWPPGWFSISMFVYQMVTPLGFLLTWVKAEQNSAKVKMFVRERNHRILELHAEVSWKICIRPRCRRQTIHGRRCVPQFFGNDPQICHGISMNCPRFQILIRQKTKKTKANLAKGFQGMALHFCP